MRVSKLKWHDALALMQDNARRHDRARGPERTFFYLYQEGTRYNPRTKTWDGWTGTYAVSTVPTNERCRWEL